MIEQLNLFNYSDYKVAYKITKPIRLIELFAGIGSQAKALKNLGANFEHYRVIEWDKYAIASYNAVHGTNFETSDITKIRASDLGIVDTHKYEYIMTYSFPCQDLSLAGKGKGMEKGSGTRSGLLWEVERLLLECDELPQILLMENVTQVHGKKNIDDFKSWINALEKLGYSCFWEDLNAKNYGIPQNRNRTFMVSIKGDYTYEFPKPFELKSRLKDVLEDQVDEKYFLSDRMINFFYKNEQVQKEKGNGFRFGVSDGNVIAKAITTRAGSRMDDNYIKVETIT
ncbi:MAG: DNA (cytosine-5-)-methyltransferase [Erysipelotrichaceae bacterium]|nr:DNA (cytosine-5-)-methyltransferase [Erysipelotrichaceae bacterium]